MLHNYDEYILNEKLLSNDNLLITEKLSFDKIKSLVKSVKNKEAFKNELLYKFNNAKNKLTKKNIAYIIVALYVFSFGIKNSKWSNRPSKEDIEEITTNLTSKESITENDVKNFIVSNIESVKGFVNNINSFINDERYVDPLTLTLSEEGKQFIINEEGGFQKTAYKLGDGKITIGYGHAEPIKSSKYKVGDTITKQEAIDLLEKDLHYFETSIKRMFRQWSKKGYNVKITQNMFDALVSMAYNMGVTRLRNTEFIDYLMVSDFETAASIIPNTKISDKFPGLKKRRENEQKLFIKDLEV